MFIYIYIYIPLYHHNYSQRLQKHSNLIIIIEKVIIIIIIRIIGLSFERNKMTYLVMEKKKKQPNMLVV
jgi:hypothetical protein